MKSPKNIMPAIDLLMATGSKSPLPWWVRPFDYVVSGIYVSCFLYGVYKIITWL